MEVSPKNAFLEYLIDAFQRTILFLDILKQRASVQEEMTRSPFSTVFTFEHEIILDGRLLDHPINYYLGRIIPPEKGLDKYNIRRAPVIVVDPRAGQGPGISGFKPESEIGVSINEGHPVYFIAFSSTPLPEQTYLDVVDGTVEFVKRVVELHPESPHPITFGNCQAGYQILMAAMLRPDLFGTIIMSGAPLSYWQGSRGKNPMRYNGGLLGGTWLTALASDLGNGKFDGANLILNFDYLNLANFLWGKQYKVYANVDTESSRYLGFEKWWGDFVLLNGDEIQYLVDQLFVGNKLTSNELVSNDGHTFDLRFIKTPIVCFVSMEDHISPPQQTLGWILDLYHSVDEIRARGQTIIYCVEKNAGHLAIFVSARVAVKEDASFVRTIDLLETLPPGLYEMVITPKNPEEANKELQREDYAVNFERRTLDDIRAFGRNSEEDDKAFATVFRLSQLNLSIYRTLMQPFVRAVVSEPFAELLRNLHPLRLSYTMFGNKNLAMSSIASLAENVRSNRKPVASDNPYLDLQNTISKQIEDSLDTYQQIVSYLSETLFFAIYGSTFIQGLFGTNADARWSRQPPALNPDEVTHFTGFLETLKVRMRLGGFDEALVRALMYVQGYEEGFDERIENAFFNLAKERSQLKIKEIKRMVSEQALILQLNPDEAIKNLNTLVPTKDEQRKLLRLATKIFSTAGSLNEQKKSRLIFIASNLGIESLNELKKLMRKFLQ